MVLTKHAQLREQQRAIPHIMSALLDEHGLEWQCYHERFLQVLKKSDAALLEGETKRLIRQLKKLVKELKLVEKKTSARSSNMQIVSEGDSDRIKRKRG
jgi:hypothetical protein